LARALHRFSELQEIEGDEEGASISRSEAIGLYKTLVPEYVEGTPLSATDFENIVPLPHR
jgi:hypothetical protein